MGRAWRRVIGWLVVLILLTGGVGAAVYAFSAKGFVLVGGSNATGPATEKAPLVAVASFVRNTAPWPMAITGVHLSNSEGGSTYSLAIVHGKSSTTPPPADDPVWRVNLAAHPVSVAPNGGLVTVWISIAPKKNEAFGFSGLSVDYVGPVGLKFTQPSIDGSALGIPAGAPAGVYTLSPAADATANANYVAGLGAELAARNATQLARLMGAEATTEDAKALIATHKGMTEGMAFTAVPSDKSGRTATVTFDTGDYPPITITWSQFRWTVVRP
jgi:hypothetical protein